MKRTTCGSSPHDDEAPFDWPTHGEGTEVYFDFGSLAAILSNPCGIVTSNVQSGTSDVERGELAALRVRIEALERHLEEIRRGEEERRGNQERFEQFVRSVTAVAPDASAGQDDAEFFASLQAEHDAGTDDPEPHE